MTPAADEEPAAVVAAAQRRITAFWDAVSGAYDDERGNVPEAGSVADRAWSQTLGRILGPAPAQVLDVGTGTGFVARIAAAGGHAVVGIDLSEKMLEVARANARAAGVEVSFRCADAVAPPFAPASFDVVINRSLIWTLLELDSALRAWHALLRDTGRLICIYGLVDGDVDEGSRLRPRQPSRGAFFEQHYDEPARRLLPGMSLTEHRPLIDAVRRAGFQPPAIEALDLGAGGAAHYVLIADA